MSSPYTSAATTTPAMRSLFLRISMIATTISLAEAQHSDYQPHYLVGLLHLPNSNIPDIFRNHTTGTYLEQGDYVNWKAHPDLPFQDIPWVGFSDIEPYYADGGGGMANMALGEFFVMSDNGFGGSANSGDYPLNIAHVKLQKPFAFNHGGHKVEKYTEAELMGAAYMHDPNGLIKWENGADIQVTYKVPDDTWDDLVAQRVLTGRDIDPEGLAVINNACAIVGEELMTSLFAVNPSTGEVLSPFVRTPDIDSEGNFVPGLFLSTISDKVHCDVGALEEDADTCLQVESSVVEASEYREHHKSGGYEGFAALPDGSIAAFVEKPLGDEPGVRVYHVDPGSCTASDPPAFKSLRGFYQYEVNAHNIADVSAIPGTSKYVAVIERNNFPGLLADYPNHGEGHMFPSPGLPANKICIVDLTDLDADLVMHNKKCILNYKAISDPYDVDGDGVERFALMQVTTEQLVVVDEYCIVAGTDTNYPFTNQFGLNLTDLPYGTEVMDGRWMVVCFEEPIFNVDILEDFMSGDKDEAAVAGTAAALAASASSVLSVFPSSIGLVLGLVFLVLF